MSRWGSATLLAPGEGFSELLRSSLPPAVATEPLLDLLLLDFEDKSLLRAGDLLEDLSLSRLLSDCDARYRDRERAIFLKKKADKKIRTYTLFLLATFGSSTPLRGVA